MPEIKKEYPLIIIGAGPAGMTASIYASRYKVDNLIIGQSLGGMMSEAHKVGNFPTEIEISGLELSDKMQKHAESLGAAIVGDTVVDIKKNDDGLFLISTENDQEFLTKTVLLACGTEHRKLDLPNERKFLGNGVSYCATCDAMFYKNKITAVVGGANGAIAAALYLSEVADKVYLIYHGEKLDGETVLIDQILNNKKIIVVLNAKVKELLGEKYLEEIIVDQIADGSEKIKVDGLFIEIGAIPQRYLIDKLKLTVDDNGRVKVDRDQKTNQLGVWAAGDITDGSNNFRQIITASSEGAIAAENIFRFLQDKKKDTKIK
jgi:thioredoxin reductase (NADPH)